MATGTSNGFGLGQIGNPTPQAVVLTVRIVSIVFGVLIAWVSQTHLISDGNKGEINLALGSLISLAHLVAPLFGVEIDAPAVATKDVTAVKE